MSALDSELCFCESWFVFVDSKPTLDSVCFLDSVLGADCVSSLRQAKISRV
ncbi:hypothetical protein [uncultured Helicobacter sp.]|uniref:hypothetical protein n=1 Tax=uncultured Helicobacter sp. TaxID=175537 RepID=UPI00374E9BE5